MVKYTEEIKKYIKNNCFGKTCKNLTDELNRKFDTNFTCIAVRSYLYANGLRLTNHKYTNILSKRLKVGTIREKKNMLKIKVAQPNHWKQYQVYIYEKYHKTKVKKGEVVIFLDGNTRNFNINNLLKIDRGILGVRNANFSHIKGRAGYAMASLKCAIERKKHEASRKI